MPWPRSTKAALMLAALAASCPVFAQPLTAALSEQEAVAALKAIGGVLVHYDDRQPERPVIVVDFSHHQGFQPEWLKHLAAFEMMWGEMGGDRPLEEPAAQQPLVVSAARINVLRQRAAELSEPAEDQHDPEGWCKSRVDPARLVELCEPLRLRDGYVLRAYVFREEGNGNGVVWALPDDAEFPEPADCPALESHMLKAPKPADALDDAMEAIEGDGSAAAYLAASLLRRELREFGAQWHGCKWRTHYVLDDDPWKRNAAANDTSPLERPTSQPHEWTWIEPRPTDWRPRVHFEADRVTVTFYTYSGLQTQVCGQHHIPCPLALNTSSTSTLSPAKSGESARSPRRNTPCSAYVSPLSTSTMIVSSSGFTIQYSGIPASA